MDSDRKYFDVKKSIMSSRFQNTLAIETSCDETSVAWVARVNGNLKVVKNIVASQIPIHQKTRGVVPEVAAREHVKIIIPLIQKIFYSMGIPESISVTRGPGLLPSLLIGCETGKALALAWDRPLIAVNHCEAHVLSNWIDPPAPHFPSLCLLVSGGHSEFIVVKKFGAYDRIGKTRDDAAGEAFDKVAALLSLPYPGGPSVSQCALNGNPKAFHFPEPMVYAKNFDLSFSGLKTAVRNEVELLKKPLSQQTTSDLCASFQRAVVNVLVKKTLRAGAELNIRSILLCGGVAANESLRAELIRNIRNELPGALFKAPAFRYCTDNAAMIGAAALLAGNRMRNIFELRVDPNWELHGK